MSDSKQQTQQSILFPLLFVLFLGLKLGGIIDWSWWWVTAPMWAPISLGLAILALCVAFKPR